MLAVDMGNVESEKCVFVIVTGWALTAVKVSNFGFVMVICIPFAVYLYQKFILFLIQFRAVDSNSCMLLFV